MVQGYTTSEYGDYMIASLDDPYLNTIKVLNVEFFAGLQNSKTIGTINVEAGSTLVSGNKTDFTKFNIGDSIIIGNSTFVINQINSRIEIILDTAPQFSTEDIEYYLPLNEFNQFEYQYRWSHTNQQFSEFRDLDNIQELIFDPERPLWFDIKAEVATISSGNTISLISITFTLETQEGNIETCPQFCVECTDPFAMDGCANIKITCDTDIFQPYELTKSANIYKQLVGITNDIFGHSVTYFRTESDSRTEDVILMEYSLHNVVAKDTVKILVPDNEFPDEANTYDIFGMEFAEFEIHIVAEEFERVFGSGKKPRNKDYMYIPINNKMYEIESVSLADEFNKEYSYWRVKLTKYQDRTSVNKGEFEQETNEFTTGVEEVFGERQRDEMEKDTNKTQFQTVTSQYRDGIRIFINRQIGIKDYDLKNRWTVVSKNYYDLTNVTVNQAALEYDLKSRLNSNQNFATSMWFSPKFNNQDDTDYMLFGDLTAEGGFKIYINNQKIKVLTNNIPYEFTHNTEFNSLNWYGFILNINNNTLQMTCALYELDLNNNFGSISGMRPQDFSNDLITKHIETIEVGQPVSWYSDTNYHLRGNNMYMTNIRLFEKTIELEQHQNILNQYVVRDNQLAYLIDNAIPSLGYQKFYNAR